MVNNIKKIMEGSNDSSFFSFGSFLYALSVAYGSLLKLRRLFYKKQIIKSQRLPCFVISIGNITLGGTGKTPMTIYIADMLKNLGYKVAILSRGYKGGSEKSVGIVTDGLKIFMTQDQAGDEPFMMAQTLSNIPVVVGKDRFKSGMIAVDRFAPDVIILDDGFQHIRLRRDLDIVLIDYNNPFGNRLVVPGGIMREPLPAVLDADAFILTRSNTKIHTHLFKELETFSKKTVFKSFHIPCFTNLIKKETCAKSLMTEDFINFSKSFQILKDRKVFAFSGICNNNEFLNTIKGFKCEIKGFKGFEDHYQYSQQDIDLLIDSAIESGADIIITTEKDYVRFSHTKVWPIDLAVIGVKISFKEQREAFCEFVKTRLNNYYLSSPSYPQKRVSSQTRQHLEI